MKLPKTIYARVEDNEPHEPYLTSWETAEEAVDGDGPSVIGVYRLVEVITARKKIEISKRTPEKEIPVKRR